MSEPCEVLAWDSNHFQLKIARLHDQSFTGNKFQRAIAWCDANHIDCLYYLADPSNPETLQNLAALRFNLIDLRITLAAEDFHPAPSSWNKNLSLRPAGIKDIPKLRKLAVRSHTETRFTKDPHFDPIRAQDLYAAWIENSVRGYADFIRVVSQQETILGYITAHGPSNQSPARIGLIAIAEQARGQGLGSTLIQETFRWCQSQEYARLSVVTQGDNLPALNMYQKAGFLISDIRLWYHKWFKRE